ncbi:hypothetical protein ASE39_09210 [Acidovorax sp. Root267]|uniref:nucleotide-binding domain containing protein n=1 Tax=Acidovorax sp. Root267 TaxID=1736505 RepID=UPI00070C5445|nr:nucleotide-binding domain containing protein [Acidovorax sp. Root267]KRD18422.1 hypothetical protein ASE39_09210 [Acidovorax sp. Root267]
MADGPVYAWAGSLSPLTAAQVQAATAYQCIPVAAQRLGSEPAYAQTERDAVCTGLKKDQHVFAYTRPTNGTAANITSAEHVAQARANLVARVVQAQAEHGTPLRRIGIAGGDTSRHAAQALQLWGL